MRKPPRLQPDRSIGAIMAQNQNVNAPIGKILGFLIFLTPLRNHRDRLA